MKIAALAIAGIAATTVPVSASAVPLLFDFDAAGTFDDLSFILDSEPLPDSFTPTSFEVVNVEVENVFGSLVTEVSFYTAGAQGGIFVNGTTLNDIGPQLFTGSTSAPSFAPGVFELSMLGGDGVEGVLTISIAQAVPAPGALGLLGLGLLAAAATGRRRL